MSQFRDTFTKDEQRENLLDYDDNAFMFFLCSITVCALIPWTVVYVRKVCGRSKFEKYYPAKTAAGSKLKHCTCSLCEKKKSEIRDSVISWRARLLNTSRLIETVALILCWLLWIIICRNLQDVRSIMTFDPFEILDVTPDSTKQQIKKAYRLMSLKYHPDKNVSDPTTGAKFLLIAKAYQTLTDEVAKQNYEKYGNPDGPGVMKIGVGLPKFLVGEKNQLFVLAFFFLFLLVFLPMVFLCYYQRQKKYAPNGVMVETVRFTTHCMSEATRLKNLVEYLAASGESRAMKTDKQDNMEMNEICEAVVEGKKRIFTLPIIVRNYYLILAHMQRLHHMISPRLREQLNQLLRDALPITNCMVEIALLSDWFNTAVSVLEFRRCLIQGIDSRNSTLLQIPHFTDETVRHCQRGKNAIRELADFLKQNADERKGIMDMSAEDQIDVSAYCDNVTTMKLDAYVAVEDEAEIVVGDVATCHITLTRTNLKEGEAAGAVHCPLSPEPKYEEWWLFLMDKGDSASNTGRIISFICCKSLERVVKETIQFRIGRTGKNVFSIIAMCDSFAGSDVSVDVEFRAYTPIEKPREIFIHPDDIKLDEEPTLFQQMLGDMCTNSSDEEEVFDPDESNKIAIKKKSVNDDGSKTTDAPKNEDAASTSVSNDDQDSKSEKK